MGGKGARIKRNDEAVSDLLKVKPKDKRPKQRQMTVLLTVD